MSTSNHGMRQLLAEPWDWEVVALRCPLCGAEVRQDPEAHADDHDLNGDLDTDLGN